MTESTPPEGQQPLTREQTRQLQRRLAERILDRAESDPDWKQLLIDDPELAMREANFPEAQQLRQEEVEVHGHQGVLDRYKKGSPTTLACHWYVSGGHSPIFYGVYMGKMYGYYTHQWREPRPDHDF